MGVYRYAFQQHWTIINEALKRNFKYRPITYIVNIAQDNRLLVPNVHKNDMSRAVCQLED